MVHLNQTFKNRIHEVVNKYNGKERICGLVDCNMMILEIYEPELFKLLHGKYNTIEEGFLLSKSLTDYKSIKSMLRIKPDYHKVNQYSASFGTIITTKKEPCTALHLGNTIFAVINNKFGFAGLNMVNDEHNNFYRR